MGVPGDEGVVSRAEIGVIYHDNLPNYRRVAAAISGDREAAADLVQEAFVRAVRDIEAFVGRGSLEAWLWRIVVNVAKNHRRDARVYAELPMELATSLNGDAASDVERVRAALSALPERQRIVLFLRYYADLDYGSIAEAAEISAGTVGATLTAARTTLERVLLQSEAAQ